MHPSATRSIRIPSVDTDPDEVKDDVLEQYRDLIAARTERVEEQNGTGSPADMRTGWLLWQTSLRSFLYFEEPMVAPDPEDFTAVWKERGTGSRKGSRNLWIYEKASGRKRFSVTTAAGIKIQPYFDVPPRTDPNVYVWQVVGEPAPDDMVRMWITSRTARALRDIAGRDLSPDVLESVISQGAQLVEHPEESADVPIDALVEGVLVPSATYQDLVQATGAMNDEHALQLILEALLTV